MFKARLRAPAIAIVAIVFASLLASPAQAASTKYPLIVKFGGYTTKIAKKPTKIISLSPSATEIFYAIGAKSQILAVDNLSNYPAGTRLFKMYMLKTLCLEELLIVQRVQQNSMHRWQSLLKIL